MPSIVIFIAVALSFITGAVFAVVFKRNYPTAAALACTVTADIFLVLLDDYYAIALVFFSAAQVLYMIRILRNEKFKSGWSLKNKLNIILRLITIPAATIAVSLTIGFDILLILVCFYIVNFVYNVVFAFIDFKRDMIFAAGLLLFLGCDICVGLMNLPDYTSVTLPINMIYNFMWAFYLPSQILIALSVIKKAQTRA